MVRRDDDMQKVYFKTTQVRGTTSTLPYVLAFCAYLAPASCAAMVRLFSRVTISLTLPSKGSDVTNLNSFVS